MDNAPLVENFDPVGVIVTVVRIHGFRKVQQVHDPL